MPSLIDQIAQALSWDQEVYGPYYQGQVKEGIEIKKPEAVKLDEKKRIEKVVPKEVVVETTVVVEEAARESWNLNEATSLNELHQHFDEVFNIEASQNKIPAFWGNSNATVAVLFNHSLVDEKGNAIDKKAFELLSKMLVAILLPISEQFYTSFKKTEPSIDQSEQIETDYLLKQLALLNPKMVLCFDELVVQKLKNTQTKITRGLHQLNNGLKLFFTHSPFILLEKPELKREAWEDLQAFQKLLESHE